MEKFDMSKCKIGHIAYLVDNVDEAVRKAWEDFNIGPWRIEIMSPDVPTWNRGRRVKSAQKMAFTNMCGVELELIEPIEGNETYMLEEYKQNGAGLCHVGINFDSHEKMEEVAEYLRSRGYEELHHAIKLSPAGDGDNYHFDVKSVFGFVLEILEPYTVIESLQPKVTYYPEKAE